MLTRRSFLGQASTLLPVTACQSQTTPDSDTADPTSISARRQAAWRKRPLIIDDDDDLVYADETLQGPDAFAALRLHDYRASDVNSIAWCQMWGIAKKGKTPVRYWQTQMRGVPFQENLPDPTTAVTRSCRDNRIEALGSIRMNDCHDAFGLPFPKLVYPLKVEHPELLLGNESQRRGGPEDGLAAAMWSGLDFAHESVRADRLWWIDNTARRYDLDGVDLNFFRMPFYFKLGAEDRGSPLMTDLIRDARRRLDEAARDKGRPVLLGVRIPGTLETCRLIGLDLETWLREGLVDRLLTGGGYVCYNTPAEELVQLGHRYDVPVYPCINCPANYELGQGNLRAAASNLWWAGADGLYLWNFQYIPTPDSPGYGRLAPEQYTRQLPELADPAKLKYLDKSFAVNRRWWEQYQRASAPARRRWCPQRRRRSHDPGSRGRRHRRRTPRQQAPRRDPADGNVRCRPRRRPGRDGERRAQRGRRVQPRERRRTRDRADFNQARSQSTRARNRQARRFSLACAVDRACSRGRALSAWLKKRHLAKWVELLRRASSCPRHRIRDRPCASPVRPITAHDSRSDLANGKDRSRGLRLAYHCPAAISGTAYGPSASGAAS